MCRSYEAPRRGGRTARLTIAWSLLAIAPITPVARRVPANPSAIVPGRIEGQVLLSTTLTAKRPRFRIYSDPGPGARPPAPVSDEMHNVVLYVQHAAVADDARATHATITQDDEQFQPHVLPVYLGTTVAFPNADDVFHNVFSLSSGKSFDLGRFARGSSKNVTFDKSGIVQVFCHIHSDMSAVILVLENPYFTVPSNGGHYAIENVPPGDYTVVGWHERVKAITRTVRVVAGETAKLDFNIPIPPGENAGH